MIAWNWQPDLSRTVFVDLETQSHVDVRKYGGAAYLADPYTRLLSAVFMCGDECVTWIPPGRAPAGYKPECVSEGVPPAVQRWIDAGYTFCAHNAEQFDAPAWRRFGLPSVRWVDSIHFCRLRGLPAGLDGASKALGGPGKSDDRAMRLLTECKRAGVYPVGTPAAWDQLIAYNVADVRELRRVAEAVMHDAGREARVMKVSAEINARGVMVDLPFTRKLRDCWDKCRNESTDRISEMTGGKLTADNIRSVKQVKDYLASLGFHVESLNSGFVNQILNSPEDYIDSEDHAAQIVALLADRQNAVRATVGKLDRILGSVEADECVRGVLVYCGAQATGRYSSRVVQVHNMPRGFELGRDYDTLLADLNYDEVCNVASRTKHPQLNRRLTSAEVLTTLTRSVLRARPDRVLVPFDFMAVEARKLAWLARCDAMLSVFANPKADIYCDMASKLYGRRITKADKNERQVGKVIVLGCGYGMSATTFAATCKVMLVDLDAAGVTAEQCVKAYREGYPEVPALWKAYERAAFAAIQFGRESVAGRCLFRRDASGYLCIELPSGRVLRYRNARVEMRPAKWAPQGPPVPQMVYDSGYGYAKTLYGGLICENIDQGSSRDLLAHAVCTIPRDCVMHVHDEAVFEMQRNEAARAFETIGRGMVSNPDWAGGFPAAAEGFVCTNYAKNPPADAIHGKFYAQG